MAKVLKGKNYDGTDYFVIECPACECGHMFDNKWEFNGDIEKPTFHPSLLVRSGHYMKEHKGECWCTYNRNHPEENNTYNCCICHSFVIDGKIQYLNDCTHAMAGQSIELEDI